MLAVMSAVEKPRAGRESGPGDLLVSSVLSSLSFKNWKLWGSGAMEAGCAFARFLVFCWPCLDDLGLLLGRHHCTGILFEVGKPEHENLT
jgi:hypothetical protein